MWVFGYGSLMADGWEVPHGCTRRCHASLPGFSRAFDKASTESRGSREHPAPTLRLVVSDGACQGVAFEFSDSARARVIADLTRREGNTFPLREKQVRLEDGQTVTALVPVYEGKQLIDGKSLYEIAAMAIAAKGIRGTGVQYVRDVAGHLARAGIDDPAITNLLREIENRLAK